MKRHKVIGIMMVFAMAAISWQASLCQTESLLVPSDLKQKTIVTEPVTLSKGFFRAGLQFSYRVVDRQFDNLGEKQYFTGVSSGSSSSLNFAIQYGISDRLEMSVLAEYQNNRIKNPSETTSTESNTTTSQTNIFQGIGFGDTHIAAGYQVFSEDKNKVSLTAVVDAILPTGKKNLTAIINTKQYDLPVGDGSYAMAAGLLARTIIYPYSFTAFINYTRNFSGSEEAASNNQDNAEIWFGNKFEAGVTTNLHLTEWIVFTNEVSYYHEGAGQVTNPEKTIIPASWALTYEPKLFFQVKSFRLAESVTIPLKGKNVPSDPLFVMLIQYVF
jgi:hypothetical protein